MHVLQLKQMSVFCWQINQITILFSNNYNQLILSKHWKFLSICIT